MEGHNKSIFDATLLNPIQQMNAISPLGQDKILECFFNRPAQQ